MDVLRALIWSSMISAERALLEELLGLNLYTVGVVCSSEVQLGIDLKYSWLME